MQIFLTGATGFIGGALAHRLLDEGHRLRLLVRTPAKAKALEERGAVLVEGDMTRPDTLAAGMEGVDAVIHSAAHYELGPVDRVQMRRVNVEGTRHLLEAAGEEEVGLVVYVSSIAAKGDTGGPVRDEGFEHRRNFVTWYEWTKWKSHQVAREFVGEGLPIRIVMPGTVYGPGDPSAIGAYFRDFVEGRLPARIGEDAVNSFVHVDDVVDGIVRVLERGEDGGEYLLAGFPYSYGELNERLRKYSGRPAPRLALPMSLARVYAWLSETWAGWMGTKVLVTREGVAMLDGVSFAFSSMKAVTELGWEPRNLDVGLPPTLRSTMGEAS